MASPPSVARPRLFSAGLRALPEAALSVASWAGPWLMTVCWVPSGLVGGGLRGLLVELDPRDADHCIRIDGAGLALAVEQLVARGIGQVVLVASRGGVEFGHIAQLGQRHGAAVDLLEAQRVAVDHLDHVDVVVGQPGQHALGAQVDHHLVARRQAMRLGQRQAAIGVEQGAGGIVHAEALHRAARRGAAEVHQIALAVAQLERHLAVDGPVQIDHVVGHADLEHILALAQDAVGQHVLDLAIGQRTAVDDGRAFLHAIERGVDHQPVVGAVHAHRRVRAVVRLQVDARGLLHAHVGEADAGDVAHRAERQRLAAQRPPGCRPTG